VNIPVVFEDEWLLIADKPSGLLVIPTPKNEKRTLTSILNEDLESKGVSYRLHPCHRLDRETSGLIIYAKGKSIQQKMMEEFKDRKVSKTYVAFVQGSPSEKEGEISLTLEGKPAITKYKLLEIRKDFAILELSPLTGRTNQIRIHLKHIGLPILGETKYAFRRDFKIKAKRLCLQAQELHFPHPITGKLVQVKVGLAEDLLSFLKKHSE
jgi:23S rRNA pseudouridine1911/1915/1917 synthase